MATSCHPTTSGPPLLHLTLDTELLGTKILKPPTHSCVIGASGRICFLQWPCTLYMHWRTSDHKEKLSPKDHHKWWQTCLFRQRRSHLVHKGSHGEPLWERGAAVLQWRLTTKGSPLNGPHVTTNRWTTQFTTKYQWPRRSWIWKWRTAPSS